MRTFNGCFWRNTLMVIFTYTGPDKSLSNRLNPAFRGISLQLEWTCCALKRKAEGKERLPLKHERNDLKTKQLFSITLSSQRTQSLLVCPKVWVSALHGAGRLTEMEQASEIKHAIPTHYVTFMHLVGTYIQSNLQCIQDGARSVFFFFFYILTVTILN